MRIVPRFLLLAGLIFLARQALPAGGTPVVVVVNNSIAATAISQDDLREIFLGTRYSLSNGAKVIPVLLKGGPVHESFLKSYLGKTAEGFRTWWMQIVFTGQGLLPKTFDSEADLVDYVGRTRGTIGYVSRASVRGNVKRLSVKTDQDGDSALP